MYFLLKVMLGIIMKSCNICKISKSKIEFYKDNRNIDGVHSICKYCMSMRSKKKRLKNKEIKEANKAKIPDGYKKCYSCKIIKLKENFGKNLSSLDKLTTNCKTCISANDKAKRLARRKIREENMEKIDKDKKKCSTCKIIKQKNEFSKHADSTDGLFSLCKSCKSKSDAVYRVENKEKLKIKKQKEYILNRDKYLLRAKEYASKNKNLRNTYLINYYNTNPEAKLIKNLRNRTNIFIKKAGAQKVSNSSKLLGCTGKEARQYIESQFTKGMTWGNYGLDGWSIDHIRPCSSFNIFDPAQQEACFHYTNLRPLWTTTAIAVSYGEDPSYVGNIEKNDKIIPTL